MRMHPSYSTLSRSRLFAHVFVCDLDNGSEDTEDKRAARAEAVAQKDASEDCRVSNLDMDERAATSMDSQ